MLLALPLAAWLTLSPSPSDHGDTPLLVSIGRPDARITDLFAFVRGEDLVLAVCMDPAVPPGVTSYSWSSDVTIDIHVDSNAAVRFDDPVALSTYGGTLLEPGDVRENLTFRITANDSGEASVAIKGRKSRRLDESLEFFAGLRDDPFIRGPRIGRNVAAAVIRVPLDQVAKPGKPLLVWATASIAGRTEPFQDLAGRSLRSMFGENDALNTSTPRDHWLVHGLVPDVVIYDPARPAAYPNGRELADDVVDLVGDPRILGNDAPFPTANDVPFLSDFPYLAPPQ